MPTTPYVSEFVACIRHPDHEAGKESTFHVVITRWLPDLDGVYKPHVYGPVEPSQAAKHGFDLPAILGEVAAAAIRDREAAIKESELSRERMIKAMEDRTTAVKERDDAVKAANKEVAKKEQERLAAAQAAEDAQRQVATLTATLETTRKK